MIFNSYYIYVVFFMYFYVARVYLRQIFHYTIDVKMLVFILIYLIIINFNIYIIVLFHGVIYFLYKIYMFNRICKQIFLQICILVLLLFSIRVLIQEILS